MALEVIVTGAGGFIGKSLCERMTREGRRVLSLSHSDGDICDVKMWDSLPPAQALVHLAARSYVPDSWMFQSQFLASNVVGTQLALDWCRKHGARMVFASAYVYGIPHSLPIRETDPVRPNNPYALSKYMGEQCCHFSASFSGVDVTVLRLFNVFGRGQRDEFLFPTLIRQLSGDRIQVMDLNPRRDYVYLPDVVDAFVRALEAPSGFHCVNIGSGVSHSVSEIVNFLQSAVGTDWPVVSMAAPRPQEIPDVRADIRLADDVLGWRPTFDMERGIGDMLKGIDHG